MRETIIKERGSSREIWRDIKGYESCYQVSNIGRVRSVDRMVTYSNGKIVKYVGKVLSQHDNGQGYMNVTLYKNRKREVKYVHRLVAEAFIPNIDNKPEVNHLDENKSNNCSNNLEWCTRQENELWGTKQERGHAPLMKSIWGYNIKNGHTVEFPSMRESERILGISHSNIDKCIRGIYKQSGGYKWFYK